MQDINEKWITLRETCPVNILEHKEEEDIKSEWNLHFGTYEDKPQNLPSLFEMLEDLAE